MRPREAAGGLCLSVALASSPVPRLLQERSSEEDPASLKGHPGSSGKTVRELSKQTECYRRGRRPDGEAGLQSSEGSAWEARTEFPSCQRAGMNIPGRANKVSRDMQGNAMSVAHLARKSCLQTEISQSRVLKTSDGPRMPCTTIIFIS